MFSIPLITVHKELLSFSFNFLNGRICRHLVAVTSIPRPRSEMRIIPASSLHGGSVARFAVARSSGPMYIYYNFTITVQTIKNYHCTTVSSLLAWEVGAFREISRAADPGWLNYMKKEAEVVSPRSR